MAILSLRNIKVSFGGAPLLEDVTFNIEPDDRICLLGANGTGKSTFLRIVTGETTPDSGEVIRSGEVKVARLPQQVPDNVSGSILEVVGSGQDRDDPATVDPRARALITRLGLDETLPFEMQSGGTKRRVLLARTLVGDPDIVLLDEPTNHLDLNGVDWLESYLLRYCRTLLFVTHDRAFLRRLATRVIELDRGRLFDWRCDYDTFLQRKSEWLHDETRRNEVFDRRLEKEEAWRRQGVKARTVRNQGRLRALETMRAERRQRREPADSVRMEIQTGDRTGQIVIKADKLSFGYGTEPLIRDCSLVLTRGEKIGILGPNGCGKTTLLRLLLGETDPVTEGLIPTAGRVRRGTNLQVAYADQMRARLDQGLSVVENLADDRAYVTLNGRRRHVMGYLQDFGFTPDRARQPVGALSGGECNRLLLARLFAEPSNVLVLDEPTNDLDLDTLDLLEEQIDAYPGTVLLVSHDRTFLNNVVTGVLVFEKHPPDDATRWLGPEDGWYVNAYVGGYDDWMAGRVLPPESERVPAKSRPPEGAKPANPRRLSVPERRELAALPARIETLEREQTQWHERMADPGFYRQDGETIAQARRKSQALDDEIEAAYRRWETLESNQESPRKPPLPQ